MYSPTYKVVSEMSTGRSKQNQVDEAIKTMSEQKASIGSLLQAPTTNLQQLQVKVAEIAASGNELLALLNNASDRLRQELRDSISSYVKEGCRLGEVGFGGPRGYFRGAHRRRPPDGGGHGPEKPSLDPFPEQKQFFVDQNLP